MHRAIAFIAHVVFFITGFLPRVATADQPTGPDWVVMVFMNGDNDLERDALADFAEMAQVGSDARVKVLVQFDRNGGFATTTPQWTQTLRFEVARGMQPVPQMALEDLGEVNMGTPEALADFVRWGKRRYPSARSAVIVWDHGQGYRLRLQRRIQAARAFAATTSAASTIGRAPRPAGGGAGGYRSISDDLTDGDKLYNAELSDAFTRALGGGRIDLLGFDACLMAMVETAYAMRTHARVMVGSEDLEPAEGWRYDHWLSRLVDQPAATAEQLGELLVDSYGATTGIRPGTTLSSITLSSFDGVASAISTLADRLMTSIPSELQAITAARANCRNYAPDLQEIYHIDMIRFARELARRVSDRELAGLARAAADALDATVIRRFAHPDRDGEFGSHGLSIYFPATHEEFETDPFQEGGYIKSNTFFPVPFVQDHRWADFLQSYYGVTGTSGALPVPQPQSASSAGTTADASLERLARKVTTQANVLTGLREPSTTSHVDSGEPTVVLLASNDGVTAKARMGYLVNEKSLVDVTFTGPVSGDQAVLLTRRGLGNKVSVEVGATVVPWRKTTIRNDQGTAIATRLRSAEPSFSALVADTAAKASAVERTRLQAAATGRQGYRGIAAAPLPADAEGLRRAFSDLWRREVLGTGKVQVHSAMIVSGTYTSGANTFAFRDPSTLEPSSVSVRSEGLVGSVGWLQAQGASFAESIPRAYFGFSVDGSRSYSPQAAKNICTPLNDGGALDCASLSVGEPDVDRVLAYQGEARVWLRARTLAVAARYTYEEQRRGPRKPTRLIEFPFYFLKKVAKIDELPKPGDVSPFTGGVNVGWRTENQQRSFFILLFVGSTFGLPGIP